MTYSSVITADAPYVWYRTAETSGTSAANGGSMGGSGTYSGVTLAQSPAGSIDGNSFYTGSNGYISQVLSALPSTTFTYEFWYKRNTGFNLASAPVMTITNGNGTYCQVQISGAGAIFIGSGGSMGTTFSSTGVQDGNWHHIAFVYGGSSTTNILYVDGIRIGTVSGTLGSTGSSTLFVGSSNAGTGQNYIDEPAVYYSALTQSQIASHVNAGSPSYAATVLTDSPQHYVTFDQTSGGYLDSGSQNKTTTVTGTPTQVTGISGKALTYNGTTDYVTINSPYDFGASSTFTFECWIKSTTTTNTPTMIRRDGNGAAYLLRLNAGKVEFYCNTAGIVTTGTYADGNWHHIVGVKNGTATTLYIDGTSVGTGAATTVAQAAGAQPIYLGESTSAATEMFKGTLDEVAIYSTALTSTQVTKHYAAGLPAVNITVTPPVVTFGTTALKTVAPSFAGPIDTKVTPAPLTASLTAPDAVVTAGSNVTATPTAVSLSLTTPNANAFNSYPITNDADANSGTGTTLTFGSTRVDLRSDPFTAPSGYNVSSATLNVYVITNGVSTSETINVNRPTGSWNESTGRAVGTGTTVSTTTFPASGNWKAVDITSFVQGWLAGTSANNGIELMFANTVLSQTITLASHENGTVANRPYIAVQYSPAVSVTNAVPPLTLSLDTVAPGVSETSNDTVIVPVMTAALTFPGGIPFNPDYLATAFSAMSIDVTTPDATPVIAYPTILSAPAIEVGTVELESNVSISLTTNRISPVFGAMGLALKWPGIYIEGGDRYLTMLPGTMDADDIWYKMDEASGTRPIDAEYTAGSPNLWQQSGTYYGNPAFRISDGPELRPAVHFNGLTDYMRVGPYSRDNQDTDADLNDVYGEMSVTIEFSIRTTQQNGVIYSGTGAGQWQLAQISQSYYSLPAYTQVEVRLENGQIVLDPGATSGGVTYKARKNIADGQWHHVVFSISGGHGDATDSLTFEGNAYSYVAIDGKSVLARPNFLFTGERWLPFLVGARASKPTSGSYFNLGLSGSGTPTDGFLAMDMRDFVVRLNDYQPLTTTERLYYEWSNATVNYPEPMTVSLAVTPPFEAKGNVKKMLALYGLPWGYSYQHQIPIDTYLSVLSGMGIANDAHTSGPVLSGSFQPQAQYSQVRAFRVGEYLVYPVDYTGGYDVPTSLGSAPGIVSPDASYLDFKNGVGEGGFYDDETGTQRFINLQNDLAVDVTDFDCVTVVNYPWEEMNNVGPNQNVSGFGASSAYPPQEQLNMHIRNLTDGDWTRARDNLRDSILQAAYDGVNLWIGEYHAAKHLGFIEDYVVHDTGHISADKNTYAKSLDVAHEVSGIYLDYLGGLGHYNNDANKLVHRRITAEIPGLTDLPTTEYGEMIDGYSIDRWRANGDFLAYDVVRRPNGLHVGDWTHLPIANSRGGIFFFGYAPGTDLPGRGYNGGMGYFQGIGNEDDVAIPTNPVSTAWERLSIISANPDGVVGTVVSREQLGYYSDNGVWVDNPYANNVLTIAAEIGTVVRGRAIAGRAFIEMMDTSVTPTTIGEDVNKTDRNPNSFHSKWDFDSRRSRETILHLTSSVIKLVDGAFQSETNLANYIDVDDSPQWWNKSESMHSRGLNWLAQKPELHSGDVTVFHTAMTVKLTTPAPVFSKTASPTVQVIGAMNLYNLEIRQPKNYWDGTVEERATPLVLSLEMRGLGKVVTAPVMSVSLTTVAPIVHAASEMITVYIDADSTTPIPLFLKEDN
jgi:hypothetical protein